MVFISLSPYRCCSRADLYSLDWFSMVILIECLFSIMGSMYRLIETFSTLGILVLYSWLASILMADLSIVFRYYFMFDLVVFILLYISYLACTVLLICSCIFKWKDGRSLKRVSIYFLLIFINLFGVELQTTEYFLWSYLFDKASYYSPMICPILP